MTRVVLVFGPSMRYKEIQSVTSNLYLLPNLYVYNLGMCIHKSKAGLYTRTNPGTAKPWFTDIYLLSLVCTHSSPKHSLGLYTRHTLVLIHTSKSVIFCCMYTLVIGSPTCGLPGCIMQPTPTFVNCVYTTKILQ
jgi:hypothetical protein